MSSQSVAASAMPSFLPDFHYRRGMPHGFEDTPEFAAFSSANASPVKKGRSTDPLGTIPSCVGCPTPVTGQVDNLPYTLGQLTRYVERQLLFLNVVRRPGKPEHLEQAEEFPARYNVDAVNEAYPSVDTFQNPQPTDRKYLQGLQDHLVEVLEEFGYEMAWATHEYFEYPGETARIAKIKKPVICLEDDEEGSDSSTEEFSPEPIPELPGRNFSRLEYVTRQRFPIAMMAYWQALAGIEPVPKKGFINNDAFRAMGAPGFFDRRITITIPRNANVADADALDDYSDLEYDSEEEAAKTLPVRKPKA